jgi:carbon monoxide dehydrogenase subunit G
VNRRHALSLSLSIWILASAMVGIGCAAAAPAPAASPLPASAGAPPSAGREAPTIALDATGEDVVHVEEELTIDAPIEQIWRVFDDPQAYRSILPLVRSLEPRGKAANGAMRIALTQGISIASGSYTAQILKVRPYELDLRVDHAFPSILRDGHGRVELKSEGPNRTRVLYSMTADLGDSWILSLFAGRVRNALTKPPYLLKSYVEGRR